MVHNTFVLLHTTGIYLYKSHPIFQVDILGTVVFKREREDFYSYGGNGINIVHVTDGYAAVKLWRRNVLWLLP